MHLLLSENKIMAEKIESSTFPEEEIPYEVAQEIFWLLNRYRSPKEFDAYLKRDGFPSRFICSRYFMKQQKIDMRMSFMRS